MPRYRSKITLTSVQVADLDERVLHQIRTTTATSETMAVNLRSWLVSNLPRRDDCGRFIDASCQRLRKAGLVEYKDRRWRTT